MHGPLNVQISDALHHEPNYPVQVLTSVCVPLQNDGWANKGTLNTCAIK
jgi:hypothetical protein